jgi:hypothetical protein
VEYLPPTGKGGVLVRLPSGPARVERAVEHFLQLKGYEVIDGGDVQLASHVLTGKFMAAGDCDTFKNWATNYGYTNARLDRLLADGAQLLRRFNLGETAVLHELLNNLEHRWDAYYNPVKRKRERIRIFTAFLRHDPVTAARWIRWYSALPYDPGGAPDLFAWNPSLDVALWAEVKSIGDSVREGQWIWFEGFVLNVGLAVYIIRLLPQEQLTLRCTVCEKEFQGGWGDKYCSLECITSRSR